MRPPDGTASAGFPSLMISTAEARVPQPPGVEASTASGKRPRRHSQTEVETETERDGITENNLFPRQCEKKTCPKEQKVSWLLEHNKFN